MFDEFKNKQAEQLQKQEIQRQLAEKQQIYMRVFEGPDGEAVLEDLSLRCFNSITTYDDMPHKMAFNEGRRSVYAHIIKLLNRDISDIVEELTRDG